MLKAVRSSPLEISCNMDDLSSCDVNLWRKLYEINVLLLIQVTWNGSGNLRYTQESAKYIVIL